MFTSHDERIHYSEKKIDKNTIKELNQLHKYPYIMSGNEGVKLFQNRKKPVLFVNVKENERQKYEQFFFNIAKNYRKKEFYVALFDGEKNKNYEDYIAHPDNNYPKICIIDTQYGDYQKWYLNGTFNENNVLNQKKFQLNKKMFLKLLVKLS